MPRARARFRRLRPEQRDRLGEVPDVVVGHRKKHGIDPLGDECANQSGLGVLKGKRACQSRECISALGIGRRAKIVRHQPQLVVARRFEREAIEKLGETVHTSAASASSAGRGSAVSISSSP